jgi:alpha-galactosidase/6-phospho-beta-glucosidase family protein
VREWAVEISTLSANIFPFIPSTITSAASTYPSSSHKGWKQVKRRRNERKEKRKRGETKEKRNKREKRNKKERETKEKRETLPSHTPTGQKP